MKHVVSAITLLIVLFVAGWYVDSVAHDEISQAVKLAVFTIALTAAALAIITAVILSLVGVERFRLLQAQRKLADREAQVLVVTAGHSEQVYIREQDNRAAWRAAHLDPRTYANGKPGQPTELELRTWALFNRPSIQAVAAGQPMLLPGITQIDLLAALDSVQRCLIVGASDTGKTTLLQWLVSRRLNTSKVIVIDPHSYPAKYPAGADVIGQGRNYHEIERALTALVKLMTKRYDEIGRGLVAEMAHSRVTILIDEWRAITGNLGKPAGDAIKALLTESRKAAFSVFVASHSDRAKPLGLEGEYDLKDGFAIVRLSNVNGVRTATLDTGNGEIPAVLPGPFTAAAPQLIEHSDVLELAEVEPPPEEAEILYLHQQGKSLREISQAVWGEGKFGQHFNDKIKKVLEKYGE